MTEILTGMRVAISGINMVNPATQPQSDVLNFAASHDEGIEIVGVRSLWSTLDRTGGAGALLEATFTSELHLEDGPLEGYGFTLGGANAVGSNLSSDVIYTSHAQVRDIEDQVNGQGASSFTAPQDVLWFPPDMRPLAANDITHRAQGTDDNFEVVVIMFIYYRWIRMSVQEIARLFASRR